jgi:hypothetical protein
MPIKKNNTTLIENLKKNKKLVYIFSGLCLGVIVIYVLLIPTPSQLSTNRPSESISRFSSNDDSSLYKPSNITFDNFNLPSVTQAKIFGYTTDSSAILRGVLAQVPGLTVEDSSTSNVAVLYSNKYKFSYDKTSKVLFFNNSDTTTVSSKFDNFSESNMLQKLNSITAHDFTNYQKVESKTLPDGSLSIGYSLKFDGISLEFAEGKQTNLDIVVNKNGRLTYLYWNVTDLDSGAAVKLMTLSELKSNFSTLKKYLYQNRYQNDPSPGASQGLALDDTQFTGTIKVTGATIVYFSQNQDSNYVIPAYKLKAKYIENNKESDGFIYVAAYLP